jgi:hypothetical protein
MTALSNQPLTIMGVWRTSWQLYRKIFSQVWFLAVILGILSSAWLLYTLFFEAKLGITAKIVSICVIMLVSFLLNTYLNSVILYRAYIVSREQNGTLGDSLLFVAKKYYKIVICDFLGVFLMLLGMVLLVLPGIYVAMIFFLIQPLVLLDNKGIFVTLKNVFKLAWGNWWRTFVIFFPLFFVFGVGVIPQYVSMRVVVYVLVGNALVIGIFCPLISTCTLVLYNDLKLRHMNKQRAAMSAANAV